MTRLLLAAVAILGLSNFAHAQCAQTNLANGQYIREGVVGFQPRNPNWRSLRCYCDAGHQLIAGGCDVTPESGYVVGMFTSSIPVVHNNNTLGWLCQLNYQSNNAGTNEKLKTRVICKP